MQSLSWPVKRRTRIRILECLAAFILAFSSFPLAVPPIAQAASTFFVAPAGNDGNACTSIGAPCATIASAISKAASGDTINVAAGTYNERITLDRNLTLNGAGAGSTAVDGQAGGTVVTVNSGITAAIASITIRNGNAANGGGIFNGGILTVSNSAITGNTATNQSGGGIHSNNSGLTVTNSTISGNSALNGGGIFGGGTVTNSTITGNSAAAGFGGGIYVSVMTVTNSTITGNSAADSGGIYTGGNLTLSNSTITGNSATTAGGLRNNSGTINIRNTIVAKQTSGADCVGSAVTSGGHNLQSGTSCNFTGTGDQQSVSNGSLNLGALTSNGGPTQTMALLTGSVAINAGGATCGVSTDQRGVARPQGAACDIGAYEYPQTQLMASIDTANVPATWEIFETKTFTVMVTNTGSQTWNAAGPNPIVLNAHFLTSPETTSTGNWTHTKTVPLSADLLPGQSVTLTVTMQAPSTLCCAALGFRMIKQSLSLFPTWATVPITMSVPSATIATGSVPLVWTFGQPQTFNVTVQNTGVATWDDVGTHRVLLEARFVGKPPTYFSLSAPVSPTGSQAVSVTLQAPYLLGAGQAAFQLHHVSLLTSFPASPETVGVTVKRPLEAGIDTTNVPTAWTFGETKTFTVTVENTGTQTWNQLGPNPIVLNGHFLTGPATTSTANWTHTSTVALLGNLAPGGSVTLTMTMTAPPTACCTEVSFQMLKQGVSSIWTWAIVPITLTP